MTVSSGPTSTSRWGSQRFCLTGCMVSRESVRKLTSLRCCARPTDTGMVTSPKLMKPFQIARTAGLLPSSPGPYPDPFDPSRLGTRLDVCPVSASSISTGKGRIRVVVRSDDPISFMVCR